MYYIVLSRAATLCTCKNEGNIYYTVAHVHVRVHPFASVCIRLRPCVYVCIRACACESVRVRVRSCVCVRQRVFAFVRVRIIKRPDASTRMIGTASGRVFSSRTFEMYYSSLPYNVGGVLKRPYGAGNYV